MPTIINGTTGINQVQSNVVEPGDLTQPLTLVTAKNTTSGTSIDVTGIPSWVNRVTVMLNGVSTNGTSLVQFQLGSGSVQTTGYVSTGSNSANAISPGVTSSTSGLLIEGGNLPAASWFRSGRITLERVSGNLWVASSTAMAGPAATNMIAGAGAVTLSGPLDRIRLTTVNGTDTFDAGSISIMYE